MTDRTLKKLDLDVQEIISVVLELQDLAHIEDEHSAWRNAGSGRSAEGVASDPTFARVDDDRRTVSRDAIATGLSRIATQVRTELARQRPTRTGECATRGCKGDAFFAGYCDRCDVWRRNNPGQDPADVVHEVLDARGVPTGETRSLIDDWNRALPRFCACSCCDECHDRAAEGRRVSNRCHAKIKRLRAQERAAS